MKRKLCFLLLGLIGLMLHTQGQLYIDGATVYASTGSVITVQNGDVISNMDIQGDGTLLMKGTNATLYNLNMNNGGTAATYHTVPRLELDNSSNINLTGNSGVVKALIFTNGKLIAGSSDFYITTTTASITGATDNKFIETDGVGYVHRLIGNSAASGLLAPVGYSTTYAPVMLDHSGGSYSGGILSAQVKFGIDPNKPDRIAHYLKNYWPLKLSGITGGDFTATGTYNVSSVTGDETKLYGFTHNGTSWNRGSAVNMSLHNTGSPSAELLGSSGTLYAMNDYVNIYAKVLLQGANPVSGIMNDGLRTGTNVIPTTEPYRGAPYSTAPLSFVVVDGGARETTVSSAFADQSVTNDNIVDWVFVELRTGVTSGSTIVATRSGLLQRDGDIVDIDGVSPLMMNAPEGNYTVTVKHRNHLPISTNSTGGYFVGLGKTPVTVDFTTLAASSILGVAGTNYYNNGTYNMLYAGNANMNGNVRYLGISNDQDYILNTLLGGNRSGVLSGIYSQGDINMNKGVRYLGISNDQDFILNVVLRGVRAAVKTQILPL